jgi:3-deoxy-7-phosphoheptulonate synthase
MKDLKLVRKTDSDVKAKKELLIIAGPCTIENEESLELIANEVKTAGATMLRGGAFKPRTSPYDFQGLGLEGLKILSKVGKKVGLPVVSEVVDSKDIDCFLELVDVIQVGSRNVQNFSLLKELGKIKKPILLKRGASSTYKEWLSSAEYIMLEGNPNIILCERGIRSFEDYTRNVLDISAVPVMKELTHLPIIVDPSHGTGKSSLVIPMSLAAIASGADGIMVEVHPCPSKASCDAKQSITLEEFSLLSEKIKRLRACL